MSLSPESLELTLEQQFQYRLMEASAESMTTEQAQDLLVQATRLLMVKENVINALIKRLPGDEL